MNRSAAEIVREYRPFPGVDNVHGVMYDGQQVSWLLIPGFLVPLLFAVHIGIFLRLAATDSR